MYDVQVSCEECQMHEYSDREFFLLNLVVHNLLTLLL